MPAPTPDELFGGGGGGGGGGGAPSADVLFGPHIQRARAAAAKSAHHGGGGGVLGFLGRAGQGALDTAESSLVGVYDIGKHTVQGPGLHEVGREWSDLIHHGKLTTSKDDKLIHQDLPAIAKSQEETFTHPLRHPFNTALNLAALGSLGAGTAFRAGAAARAASEARAAAEAGAAVSPLKTAAGAFLQNPALTQARTLRFPGEAGKAATATGTYSRSGLGMAAQKATDAALQRGAEIGKVPRVGERIENRLQARAAKWDRRNEKTTQAQLRASGNRVAQIGRKLKLKPAEQRALRIVAEGIPYDEQLATTASRLEEAKQAVTESQAKLDDPDLTPHARRKAKKELRIAQDSERGHEARLQWTEGARGMLAEGPDGTPMIHPENARLQQAWGAMTKAVGSREALLRGADLLDEEHAQNALRAQARMAAGAKYVKPTPGRLGNIKGYHESVARVARLEKIYNRRIAKAGGRGFNVERPRTAEEGAAHLDTLERERTDDLDEMARAQFGPIDMKEVRFRNIENAKARRQAAGVTKSGRLSGASGVKARLRPTVTEERRGMIAQQIADALEGNPDHPTLQGWAGRDAEIDKLREATTPSEEEAFGGAPTTPKDYGTIKEYRHPSPFVERAGSALSVARDEYERKEARRQAMMTPTGLVGAEHVTPGERAIMVGNQVQPARFGITGRVSSSRTLGHTRTRGSLKAATGLARERGLERNDVTEMLAERQHEAVGLTSLARLVDRWKDAGHKTPQRPDDVFMWTDGKTISSERVHPDIRKFLDGVHDPNADPLEEEVLREGGAAAAMKRALIQLPEQAKQELGKKVKNPSWEADDEYAQRLQDAADGKGVFIPRRLLGERVTQQPWKLPPRLKTGADVINNAGRLALIYLKVNYPLVQGLSNVALNLIQQGVFAPANLTGAARLGSRLGPDLSAMVDDAVEQGFAGQVGFRGKGSGGPLGKGTQKVAHYAGLLADKVPRRAAWLHEARRQGYTTPEEINDLLTNPEKLTDLQQVTQRAKEAIVDFGDLTPIERDFLRNIVFVYPWVKGSTVYAGRFLRDHPLQAAALSNLGEQGAKEQARVFGAMPTYDMNMLPVGGGRAIDLASMNPFGTPAELGRSIVGTIRGGKIPSEPALTYASPAVSLAMQLASRRDEGGFPLKGNVLQQARNVMLTQSPISQLATSLAPGAVTHAIFGAPIQSKTYPNQSMWLKFLLGGLSPRKFDTAALHRAAAYQTAQR